MTASKASAPSNSSLLQALLKPTSDGIGAIQNFRESHRGSPHFNHLSAVSESIPALGWVAVVSVFPLLQEFLYFKHYYSVAILNMSFGIGSIFSLGRFGFLIFTSNLLITVII